jgi:hypothetical protein
MTDEDMAFWEDIDERILDIIDLIRLKYRKFNNTPVEKVIVALNQAYKSSGRVCDAIDKGWL